MSTKKIVSPHVLFGQTPSGDQRSGGMVRGKAGYKQLH